MSNELDGKVAVVTGGAGGLGRGIAERFLAEGAKVVVGDIAEGEPLGGDSLFVPTDVSDIEQVGALVSTAIETFGGLDIMVNNAGVSGTMHRRFLEDDLADFHTVMGVNVLGVMAGTRDAARYMAEHGGGSILNLTSIGGIQAGGGVQTYRASKAARHPVHQIGRDRVGVLRHSGQCHCARQHPDRDRLEVGQCRGP